MSGQPTIRTASLDDYVPMCALLDELDELHRKRLPWLFRAPAQQPRAREYFEQLLSSSDSTVLVAETNAVVGIAIIVMRSAPEFPVFIQQRWAVLDGLVVSPTERRRGIGKLLVRAAEEWTSARGAPWIELGVYEFNSDARKFYEALGYLPVSSKLRKPVP